MSKTLSLSDLVDRGACVVAATATHQLFEFPHKASPPWRSFYLQLRSAHHSAARKHAWWFGHNGERFARCRDVQLLEEYEPEIYDWLQNLLDDRPDG